MKRVTAFALLVLVLVFGLPYHPCHASAEPLGEIYFDDSQPDFLILGNDHFEISFRKTNGGIAGIIDKSEGSNVTLGSRWECLWGAAFTGGTPDYTGGCHFAPTWPNRFSYAWSPDTRTLLLSYDPDPAAARQVRAKVWVQPSTQPWVDMRMELDNRWGLTLDRVLFPSDLVFSEPAIKEAILPIQPGLSLRPEFFTRHLSYVVQYPGWPGVFADMVYVRAVGGELSIYTLRDPQTDRVRPTFLGFLHDDIYVPKSTMLHHAFGVRLPTGTSWASPAVRFLVGVSPWDTALAYREDLHLSSFPSLRNKLGNHFAQIARSPLYKADAVHLNRPFTEYAAMLDRIPYPGLLHPVAFQPRGHDENYPDVLPPDPRWGMTADMATMFRAAQARGFLVMPYTNPTWWDDESPTLNALPPGVTITDVAAINWLGQSITNTYGSHFGYVASPWAPFVRDRLDRLNHEMTVDVPSDLLFEDQIGARPWLYDYNRFAPDHLAYMDGWLAHTRTYSPTLLMTEMGYDRLGETEAGFHGSILLAERTAQSPDLPVGWVPDVWMPYPLAPTILRDKVFFYQHDLAPETFTHDKTTLGWNLAMGYMLSYDLVADETGGGLDSGWLTVVGALQQRVLSRYADARVAGFSLIQAGGEGGPVATQTDFGDCSALVNWDGEQPFPTGEHTLPPRGSLVRCQPGEGIEGGLVAGVFTNYRGAALSPDDHYLIEERGRAGTAVRQLMGADTPLVVAYPLGVPTDQAVLAEARARDGRILGFVPTTPTPRGLQFEYHNQAAGEPADHYWLPGWPRVYLPLIMRK